MVDFTEFDGQMTDCLSCENKLDRCMRVFISFSGDASQQMALALHDWIRRVMHGVQPWMSHRDVAAGNIWMETLLTNLRGTNFGIICLTPENKNMPWLHFEAGAVWRNVEAAHVCPYLLSLSPEELVGSLREFQSLRADRDGTLKLLEAINAHQEFRSPMDSTDLREAFDVWWPRLESRLQAIQSSDGRAAAKQPIGEMVAETLELVRRLAFDRFGKVVLSTDLLSIDVRTLVGASGEVWQAPFASFRSIADLLNDIYFRLDGAVEPFSSGRTWFLRESASGVTFREIGAKWSESHGMLRDDRTLFLPDRLGNNRIDSLRNFLENPHIGMLFLIPGVGETLRVNGVARIVLQSELLAESQVNGKTPKSGLLIEVREAFLQCAKALIRSRLWHSDQILPREQFPTLGKMLVDQTGVTIPVGELDALIDQAYCERLY
ncbi:MAG: hypothetical protein B7Z55_07640 [Planctomycetales bacterium 12-60-4]|nr:MAG: hypothetical protein B7Z55_07640 [Planctomycetales bacterium 12-60-4]